MKVATALKKILGIYYEAAINLFNDVNNNGTLDIYIIYNSYPVTESMFYEGNIDSKYNNICDVYPSDIIDKYKEHTYVIYNAETRLFLNSRMIFTDKLYLHAYNH